MNEIITTRLGGCKVNITFGKSNPDLKGSIVWTMMENYKSRVMDKAESSVRSEQKKKSK